MLAADGGPTSELNSGPAISDDGSVVVYVSDTSADGTGATVTVRDRKADTTLAVAESGSGRPAISGDGCTVVYTVDVPEVVGDPTTPRVELRIVDRCANPGALGSSTLVGQLPGATTSPSTPAVSADGGAIVWSTGSEVARYRRFTDGSGSSVYLQDGTSTFAPVAGAVDATLLSGDVVAGADVDISANGQTVTFVAGPGTTPFAPTPRNVFLWSDDPNDGVPPVVELISIAAPADPTDPEGPGTADSYAPALSADGQVVLYESVSPDLIALAGVVPPDPVAPFVVMLARGLGSGVIAQGDTTGASRPEISADGHHAVYVRDGTLRALWWGDGTPFSSVTEEVLFDGGGSVSAHGVSANGNHVVFDSAEGAALSSDARFATGQHVWVRARAAVLGGAPVDLGPAVLPDTLTGSVTITNTGSAGFQVGAVTVDSPFELQRTTCTGVLHPGVSCTADVLVLLSEEGVVSGQVRVQGGDPPTEFTVAIQAGVAPTTTSTTTTTTPADTTTTGPTTTIPAPGVTTPVATTNPPQSTLPVGTAPVTIRTIPATNPVNTTRPTGTTSSSGTTGSSGTTTTLALPVVFDPPSFDFAPTIVNAGRRTATVSVYNPSDDPISVIAVAIEPADGSGFLLGASSCAGVTITPGDRCAVEVQFAPAIEGALSANVVADLDDGTSITSILTGIGAPPPTLIANPDVASNGQVVAVQGGGFPSGLAVTLSWDDGRIVRTPTTDEVGSFAETLVVLPNTPRGPSELVVFGQVDLFADVRTELLISSGGGRSSPAVIPNLGPSMTR